MNYDTRDYSKDVIAAAAAKRTKLLKDLLPGSVTTMDCNSFLATKGHLCVAEEGFQEVDSVVVGPNTNIRIWVKHFEDGELPAIVLVIPAVCKCAFRLPISIEVAEDICVLAEALARVLQNRFLDISDTASVLEARAIHRIWRFGLHMAPSRCNGAFHASIATGNMEKSGQTRRNGREFQEKQKAQSPAFVERVLPCLLSFHPVQFAELFYRFFHEKENPEVQPEDRLFGERGSKEDKYKHNFDAFCQSAKNTEFYLHAKALRLRWKPMVKQGPRVDRSGGVKRLYRAEMAPEDWVEQVLRLFYKWQTVDDKKQCTRVNRTTLAGALVNWARATDAEAGTSDATVKLNWLFHAWDAYSDGGWRFGNGRAKGYRDRDPNTLISAALVHAAEKVSTGELHKDTPQPPAEPEAATAQPRLVVPDSAFPDSAFGQVLRDMHDTGLIDDSTLPKTKERGPQDGDTDARRKFFSAFLDHVTRPGFQTRVGAIDAVMGRISSVAPKDDAKFRTAKAHVCMSESFSMTEAENFLGLGLGQLTHDMVRNAIMRYANKKNRVVAMVPETLGSPESKDLTHFRVSTLELKNGDLNVVSQETANSARIWLSHKLGAAKTPATSRNR